MDNGNYTLKIDEKTSIENRIKEIDLYEGKKRKSQTELLIEIGNFMELFHDNDNDVYTSLLYKGIKKTFKVYSEDFRRILTSLLFELTGTGANAASMNTALETLSAKAQFRGKKHIVYRRVANLGSKMYVDICDDQWRVIEIDQEGWRIIENSPVKFVRGKYSQSLVIPKQTPVDALNSLFSLINVVDVEKPLVLGWILGAYRGLSPFPLLNLNGDQGSGKSITTRILKALVDPNTADTMGLPRDERDFAAIACHTYLLCIDNVSFIPDWFSDCLCRASTGGAIVARRLYSDVDEVAYQISMPVILNGITDYVIRPDLSERCITINLPSINSDDRNSEFMIWKQFNESAPFILGAIFSLIATALKNLLQVYLPKKPRLADVAEWIEAAAYECDLLKRFGCAYEKNLELANELAIDSSPVALGIIRFMEYRNLWEGTAEELLFQLNSLSFELPKQPLALSNALKRLTKPLYHSGIKISRDRAKTRKRERLLIIENLNNRASVSSTSSELPANQSILKAVRPSNNGESIRGEVKDMLDEAFVIPPCSFNKQADGADALDAQNQK